MALANERSRYAWNTPSSRMAKITRNSLKGILDRMELTSNPEKERITLLMGDPTMFGNCPPSQVITNALCTSAQSMQNNGYAPSIGFEKSRQAVADFYSCPEAPLAAKDVILTSGCTGALDLCIMVLANPGQNILVPRPGYTVYTNLAESLGIEVRHYDLVPDNKWQVDLIHVESLIDENTAALIVNNPSNPCGSVYAAAHIREILEVAECNKVPIIADEIYADLVFPGQEFVWMATQTTTVPILSCGALSKRWVVPGWRMGWILIQDRNDIFGREVRRVLLDLSQRFMGPNTVVMGALETIFRDTPQEFYDSMINLVKENADFSYDAFSKIPGLKPVMPAGAMYMMVGIDLTMLEGFRSDVDFTEKLIIEQSVFALPASCFQYPNYFRIVLTVPNEKLKEACERTAEFCAAHTSQLQV